MLSDMIVAAIVQARLGSTRLPGKTMRQLLGRPMLFYLLERLRRSKTVGEIVVATTTHPRDQQIADFCRREKVSCYRGSEEDLLERVTSAAEEARADVVVRVTGDCPLIDPSIVDGVVGAFLHYYPKYEYASNVIERTFPRGMDVEVMSKKCLESIALYAQLPEEREHVTTYLLRHRDRYSCYSYRSAVDLSNLRLTVDTEEDWQLIAKIFEALYEKKRAFALSDIVDLLSSHPDWVAINAHVVQKEVL